MLHAAQSTHTVEQLREELDRVLQPIEHARGLPNPVYTDRAVYEEECRRVLFGGWACVGFAKDAPSPGDVHAFDFAGLPLIFVRDKKGTLRVFHNVCPHRGRMLVDQSASNKPALVCPYHRWSFDLTGGLIKAPNVGGVGESSCDGFDPANAHLKPVRSAEWFGVIFVDISGMAEPFETYLHPVLDRWKEFQSTPVVHGGDDSSISMEVGCNWKLAVENYCEAYHLPWVHPDLNRYSPLQDHIAILGTSISGQISTNYAPTFPDGAPAFPNATGPNGQALSAYWDQGAEYISLFPNVLLGIHRDHFYAVLILPLGPNRTLERMEIFYFDDKVRDPDFAPSREMNATLWQTVFLEDQGAVEGLQRGRHSPGYDGGVFSPVMDPPTHAFHCWIARAWLEGRGLKGCGLKDRGLDGRGNARGINT